MLKQSSYHLFNFHQIQYNQNHQAHNQRLTMLKQEKRHSQTLNSKKSKPIEITLTKKPFNNSTYNYGQENLSLTFQKGIRQALSLARPLKQKPSNIAQSHTFNLKSIKSKQQKLKQEVCPSYRLNWGSTPINSNSSRFSQAATLLPFQQNTAQQFSHLIKTVQYKKYARQVHDVPHSNPTQFNMNHMNIEESLDVIKEQQSIVNREVKQGSSMNSVKSKIKGITKSFLRDGKNASKQLEKSQLINSQVLKFMPSIDQNQSSLIQPSQELSIQQTDSNLYSQRTHEPLPQKSVSFNQQNSNDPLTLQPLTQRSALKQHYVQLQQRLQLCVEQIVEIERSNNIERIVELQNELLELKQTHEHQKNQMKKKIQDLQTQITQKTLHQNHLNIHYQTFQITVSPESNPNQSLQPQQTSSYQQQIKQLRQKVSHLTQSLHSQTPNLDTSFSQQNRSSLQLQSQIYETELLKRKQSTLEQVLDLKKKQIINKDSIIQMLLSKQVEKALISNDPAIKNPSDKKDKVTALVFEMIGYMNGKLSTG